jgi:hypothetical protein
VLSTQFQHIFHNLSTAWGWDLSSKNINIDEDLEKIQVLNQTKGFIGREFLTWVWHLAETVPDGIEFKLRSRGATHVELWVDDRVAFVSPGQSNQIITQRGGEPSSSIESAASLASGKIVSELKLGVRLPSIVEFACNLHSKDLAPRGLRVVDLLPQEESDDADSANDSDALFTHKLRHVELFVEIFDELFRRFVRERTAGDWESEGVTEIRGWIKDRTSRAGEIFH